MTALSQWPFGHEWGCAKVHLAKQHEPQSRREGKRKHYIPLILTILPKSVQNLQILCERNGQMGKDGNEENGHQAIVRYGSEQTENKVFLKASKPLKLRTYYQFQYLKLTTRRNCMMAETFPMTQMLRMTILNCSMVTNTAQKGRGPQIFFKSVGREMERLKA